MGGLGLWNLRALVARRGRAVLAVVGIVAGTVLVVSVVAVNGSARESVHRLLALSGSADLEVSSTGSAGLHGSAESVVASTPGVVASAPLVRADVALAGERVLLLGIDERIEAFGGPLGAEIGADLRAAAEAGELEASGIVATSSVAGRSGLRRGDDVDFYSATAGAPTVRVAGVLPRGTIDRVNAGNIVVGRLDTARALLGDPARTDAILVEVEPGQARAVQDRLEAALGADALVQRAEERRAQFDDEIAVLEAQILPIAVVGLVMGGLLIFNAMNMSVTERRREFAILRCLGARRRTIVGGMIGEAALLGGIGGAVGLGVGALLARRVVDRLPETLAQAIGVEITFAMPARLPVLALAFALTVSVLAGVLPAWRATRAHPLEAARVEGNLATGSAPATVAWWPIVAGLAGTGAGLAWLATVDGEGSILGIVGMACGALLVTFGLAGRLAAAAGWLAGRDPKLGLLAGTSLVRSAHRAWATTVAVAIAVALVVAVGSGARNTTALAAEHLASFRDVDLWVSTTSKAELAVELWLPEGFAEAVAGVPGVAAVTSADTFDRVVLDGHRFFVAGFDGPTAYPQFRRASEEARSRTLAGEAVIVTHQFARRFDVDVGDPVRLAGRSGVLDLPVAEVVRTVSASSGGMVSMADRYLRDVFGVAGRSTLEVELAPGADASSVQAAIVELGRARSAPVAVETGAAAYASATTTVEGIQSALSGLLVVIVAMVVLAVLNTLASVVVDRWREIGMLRAIGTTPRQLAWTLGVEAAALALTGIAIGSVLGEVLHWAGCVFVNRVSPIPVDYRLLPSIHLAGAAAAVLASLLGALGPARRATRMDVLSSIGWE